MAAPDYQDILGEIDRKVRSDFGKGKVADYIPALAEVRPDQFGMAVKCIDGQEFTVGEADVPFSIQSVSKVFTLQMALRHVETRLWERVGREPSGNPFNSLVQLEYEHGIPRNPFINAGAHVVTDVIVAHESHPKQAILNEVRRLASNATIDFDERVARSERNHGHRNFAIAHFLKAHGNLNSEVDAVLDAYFHQCSIAMSCRDLARASGFLANDGKAIDTGERIVGERRARRINALMMTCGLYDAVGNFAFRVGIPAKSGVGGAIMGAIPGKLSVCVWSPELDKSGNSLAGTRALELFTDAIQTSVF
jgi:glutaminase